MPVYNIYCIYDETMYEKTMTFLFKFLNMAISDERVHIFCFQMAIFIGINFNRFISNTN